MNKKKESFHQFIFEKANNHYLLTYSEQLLVHVRRSEHYFFNNSDHKLQSYQDHLNIIKALETKDLDRGRLLIEHNWIDLFKQIENLFTTL